VFALQRAIRDIAPNKRKLTFLGNLNLSAIQRYDSGVPYSASAAVPAVSSVANPPKYVSAPTTVTYFFSDRGAFRTAATRATDLSATFSFPALRGVELYVEGYVFNAFNNHEVVNATSGASTVIDQTVRTSRSSTFLAVDPTGKTVRALAVINPFTGVPKECPQGNTAQQCFDMGANYQLGPNFGNPTSKSAYQTPRSYSMALGLRF